MSTDPESLTERLETVKKQYRRRHVSDELDAIAKTMEETILQRVLAKAFFDEQVAVDEDAKSRVQDVLSLLEEEKYDEVEARLDDLQRKVESAEQTVENRIQELRLKHSSTVAAMRRLNDRVERVSGMRLAALEGLLDDWRWRQHIYMDEDADLDELKENASQYGKEMREAFDQLREELFGEYPDEIRNLIYRMIDDERLSYADLSSEQRKLLAESDIGGYIELTLS